MVEAVSKIPVIGNGDIRSVADAAQMFAETGCDGISIGRGALANPWIFQQLVAWEQGLDIPPTGNFDQRLELLQKQFGYIVEQKGVERAIISFRKMGHWYLSAMRVAAWLRNEFQTARTPAEFEEAIRHIAEFGPKYGDRQGVLPEFKIPVPSGPVERW